MDIRIVAETYRASLAGELPFTGVVAQMIRARVEFYQMNLVALKMTACGLDGSFHEVPLPFTNLPPIAPHFSSEKLIEAIEDSRHHGQTYPEFIPRAMQAGVQSYFAFFRGKRLIYIGRQGDQHTEWFPGASPSIPS